MLWPRFRAMLSISSLTDPPYLVGFRDRQGRTIAGDTQKTELNGCNRPVMKMLKPKPRAEKKKRCADGSFYGWNRVDFFRFMAAWKNAGFSVVGHLLFTKTTLRRPHYVGYRHECAYTPGKRASGAASEALPRRAGLEIFRQSSIITRRKRLLPSLQPLIESFTPQGGGGGHTRTRLCWTRWRQAAASNLVWRFPSFRTPV